MCEIGWDQLDFILAWREAYRGCTCGISAEMSWERA